MAGDVSKGAKKEGGEVPGEPDQSGQGAERRKRFKEVGTGSVLYHSVILGNVLIL